MFDYSVFIGRFQPFHNSHLKVCQQGLREAKHLIILIGSAFTSRSIRNPFTFEERRDMITNSLGGQQYTVLPLRDYFYSNNAWMAEVQKQVAAITTLSSSICILKNKKDSTGDYLDWFPKWASVDIMCKTVLNATDIRKEFLTKGEVGHAPEGTLAVLESFGMGNRRFLNLAAEYSAIADYKTSWASAPYPPTFVTTDAVCICGGHVLLVRRLGSPGIGLYALPGGFLGQDEVLEDSCLRELKEETRIKVPVAVLRGSIKDRRVFDHPLRSTRGRTITHAYYINLGDKELPKVRGDSDADKAFWMPLNEVGKNMDKFFEDHYQIIESFIKS